MASLAPAGPQHGRADALGLADLVVEREQVGGYLGGDAAALVRCLGRLLVDLLEGRVPAGRHRGHLAAEAVTFSGQLIMLAVERLPALHQLEHDFLKVALPAVQRLDFRLQARELARGGDLPGVQPRPVPLDPGPDLVHVALRPALFPAQVADFGLGRHQGVLELASPGLQAGEFGDFGQAVPAVVEAAELGV